MLVSYSPFTLSCCAAGQGHQAGAQTTLSQVHVGRRGLSRLVEAFPGDHPSWWFSW